MSADFNTSGGEIYAQRDLALDLVAPGSMAAARTVLARGVAAARANRRELAYSLLTQAIELDGGSARAWLWLGAVTLDPAQARKAFEYALAIEPDNQLARRGLRWAEQRLAFSRQGAN